MVLKATLKWVTFPYSSERSKTRSLLFHFGSFGYSYFDSSHPTNRVGSISYPNGQSAVYDYFGNTGDERLKQIKNLTPTSTVLSQNDYTYDAVGKILTWQQQTDSNTPTMWTEGYDDADQLTSAVLTNTQITSPAVRSDSYAYDAAGNPTTFNVSGVSRSPSYNSLNQLTGSTPSGNRTVGFTGALHGPATVTVNGSSATVNSGHYFSGTASLTPGSTNTVPVVATDSSGNSRTNDYQIVVPPEPTYSPTYDADGNETSNGAGQAYGWDAKNQLTSIVYSSGPNSGNHSEFTYDALARRTSIVERSGTTIGSGTVSSTKQLVWDGSKIAEERNVGNTVSKRFFVQGEQISGSSYYYTFDHLGSVREMTNSSGATQVRYDYDLYGRATPIGGTNLSDFQYAAYYSHQPSGLNLTLYRGYHPTTARWLSRDPLGDDVGPNLYSYVSNNPIYWIDILGLSAGTWITGGSGYQSAQTISSSNALSDALTSFENWVDSIEGTDQNNYANQLASSLGSLKGFPGDANWRNLLKQIKMKGKGQNGGNIDCSKTGVPTQSQAEDLIKQAGGVVKRVETGQPGSVHDYPHINFQGPDGTMKTIQIDSVVTPMPGKY